MKTVLLFTMVSLAAVASAGGAAASRGGFVPETRAERMAASFMSRYSDKELREIQGFFAPVVKKWTPTGEQFAAEYMSASDRNAVLVRYLPKARAFIDDAAKMKVPPAYVARRNHYVAAAEAFYAAISMYLTLGFP